jgi:MFS superfamily sulfate permease-like transporter
MSEENNLPTTNSGADIPRGNTAGFTNYFKQDFLSGFLVFLIALPLCLGIALACGYPAIAGIFTAIIGAIMATFISDSELTIKGPAAGLIVIAIGCVEAFGGDGPIGGFSEADMTAYQMALAVGVVAAVLQIIFGFVRAGILAEFFPLAAVHGMLAAIGVIIIVKQIPIALGVRGAKGEPLEMIKDIPHFFNEMNPEIALIGGISLLIMFLWPWIQKLHAMLKAIPSPLIVLLVAVPLGMFFDLRHTHNYTFHGHRYEVGENFLVTMPDRVFGMFDYITLPDFSGLAQPVAWKWVFMFFIIGSLESLLSAKAIDLLDPWKRKTNLNRDMIAVGAGNFAAAMVGGLPMISEIVRSKANIDNGARTRFANFWHGIFLLLCVALIPTSLHLIPLAALAAMLVYTGSRLAHPTEFLHVLKIGKEQLLIFVVTLFAVLATDLLIGIAIGIAVKLLIHLVNGVPVRSLFKPYLDAENQGPDTVIITARYSAIFSNWILFRKQLVDLGLSEKKNVVLDLAQTKLVDHSVMEKLHEIQADFAQAGVELRITGLENHHSLSNHGLAARKLGKSS